MGVSQGEPWFHAQGKLKETSYPPTKKRRKPKFVRNKTTGELLSADSRLQIPRTKPTTRPFQRSRGSQPAISPFRPSRSRMSQRVLGKFCTPAEASRGHVPILSKGDPASQKTIRTPGETAGFVKRTMESTPRRLLDMESTNL